MVSIPGTKLVVLYIAFAGAVCIDYVISSGKRYYINSTSSNIWAVPALVGVLV